MFARMFTFGGMYLKEYLGGLFDLPIREFMSLLTEFIMLFLCIYRLIIVSDYFCSLYYNYQRYLFKKKQIC